MPTLLNSYRYAAPAPSTTLLAHVLANYATNLQGAWRFGPDGTGPFLDSSGNGHTLTSAGTRSTAPTLLADGSGDLSLFCGGGNNAYIADAAWMNGSSVSLMARVKTPAAWGNIGGKQRIFSIITQNVNLHTLPTSSSAAGLAYLGVSGATTTPFALALSTVYTVGFTANGSTAKVYVDGAEVASVAAGSDTTAGGDFLQIGDKGGEAWGGNIGPMYHWQGRALSGADHLDLHNKALGI